jgi:hypothetical protein
MAVVLAGVLNVIGAFLSVQVARTVFSGLLDDTKITPVVIFAGLVGAILWNLLAWLINMPSSSSHALFGGLIGAAGSPPGRVPSSSTVWSGGYCCRWPSPPSSPASSLWPRPALSTGWASSGHGQAHQRGTQSPGFRRRNQ